MATRLLGDAIGANLMLVGYAYQRGLIPMSATALERAITINAVKVDFNIRAFHLGRLLAHDPARIAALTASESPPDLKEMPPAQFIARRESFLGDYRNAAYGARYRALLDKVASAEHACSPSTQDLTRTVAQVYFQLLAYKDEYEVARLYTESGFIDKLRAQFQGDFKLRFQLAPPLLAKRDERTGRPLKRVYGAWVLPLFRLLARLRRLRGTRFDVFGYLAERRQEHELIAECEVLVAEVCAYLDSDNHAAAVRLLALPRTVRGYGVVKERSIEVYRAALTRMRGIWRTPRAHQAAGF